MGLPNMQGRAPMHPGRGPGLTTRRLGERLGVGSVTLDTAQIPAHSHTVRIEDGGSDTGTPVHPGANAAVANSRGFNAYKAPANLVGMHSSSIGNTGGGQAHENHQPFLTLNFIIALQGLFPSRS